MANVETQLEDQALALPSPLRLRLAKRLLSSVKGSAGPDLTEDEANQLARSRADELDSGAAKSLEYRQEMARIRKSLSK